MRDNVLLALHEERLAALTALGYAAGGAPPPLAVLYSALQIAPLRRLYSWGVPNDAALACIARCAEATGVVEVGAGTGFWAKALSKRGVDVRAYDAAPVDCASAHNGHHALSANTPPPPFTAVLRRDARSAAAAHPRRVLLMCWPPLEDDESLPQEARSMAADALGAYKGATVCFVGEGAPGVADSAPPHTSPATAGPLFFSLLARNWTLQTHVPLPRWPTVRFVCVQGLHSWTQYFTKRLGPPAATLVLTLCHLQAYDSLTVWQRKEALPHALAHEVAEEQLVAWTPPPGAEAARASLLAKMDAFWADAAAAHILARAAAGGPRASPGLERAAVDAAICSAPLLRRMLLRLLC